MRSLCDESRRGQLGHDRVERFRSASARQSYLPLAVERQKSILRACMFKRQVKPIDIATQISSML